jgi:hypothetical protein
MGMKLINSDIVTAFDSFVIGSKVVDHDGFLKAAAEAIEGHDFSQDRVPGQGFIVCPAAIPFVSAGDGKRTQDPTDYIPALHRGRVDLYLTRERAGETQFCALVVYTTEAYLKDPEVDPQEAARINEAEATHVLVAVIASSGPESPLSPWRFTSNLAGGNREAMDWTADEIRQKARDVHDYWLAYEVVAG